MGRVTEGAVPWIQMAWALPVRQRSHKRRDMNDDGRLVHEEEWTGRGRDRKSTRGGRGYTDCLVRCAFPTSSSTFFIACERYRVTLALAIKEEHWFNECICR